MVQGRATPWNPNCESRAQLRIGRDTGGNAANLGGHKARDWRDDDAVFRCNSGLGMPGYPVSTSRKVAEGAEPIR